MKTLEELKEVYEDKFVEIKERDSTQRLKTVYCANELWQFIEEAIKEAMSWAKVDGKIRGYAAAQKDWEAGLWEDKAAC